MVDPLELRCTRGPLSGEVFSLDPSFRYLLGREPEINDEQTLSIVLESRTVSRNHALIYHDGSSWLIQDQKSYNGIRVNRTKVREAYLHPASLLEIGEFAFYIEGQSLEATSIESKITDPGHELHSEKKSKFKWMAIKEKFDDLEFHTKLFGLLFLIAILSFLAFRIPVMIQIQRDLLDQSYSYAVQVAVNLGERNKRELADRSLYLLDCDYLRGSRVIQSASLWDRQGRMVCPVGQKLEPDYLLSLAQERQELVSDCDSSVSIDELSSCKLIVPVKVSLQDQPGLATVGYAQLEYFASDVIEDVQELRVTFWKVFALVLLLFGMVWWLIRLWLQKATSELVDDVHLLFTGTAQNVENPKSFAAFEELVAEINRLFNKLNQELSPAEGGGQAEASFLQQILQQVFLLEERAVLAVDSENHVIAMTSFVPEVIPIQAEGLGLHISDAVADTHLQGELMSFLNEVESSVELVEKPLSLSDRVVQAQGMPLYFKDEHIASLIFF